MKKMEIKMFFILHTVLIITINLQLLVFFGASKDINQDKNKLKEIDFNQTISK